MGRKSTDITLLRYMKMSETDWIDAIIINGLAANPILRYHGDNKPIVRTLWHLRLGEKIKLEKSIENDNFVEVIAQLWKMKKHEILRCNVFNVFSCYNWVSKQLEEISKIEDANLKSKHKGSERLIKYGYLPLVRAIQKRTFEKEDAIYNWKYDKVFMEMCLMKDEIEAMEEKNK